MESPGLSEGLKQAVRRRRSQDSPARRRARNCSVIWRLVHHQEGTDELDGGEKDPKRGTELAMPRSSHTLPGGARPLDGMSVGTMNIVVGARKMGER